MRCHFHIKNFSSTVGIERVEYLAPMSLRLHTEALKRPASISHAPFHLRGTEPTLWSMKLELSGQMPVSSTATITSSPNLLMGHKPFDAFNPRKSGVCVVWSSFFESGMRPFTPGIASITRTCSSVSAAEKPWNTFE